jgi:flagellin-like hook-associated protein FlgL
MMTNTTLLHINRNMRQLDEVIRQMESTKRVGRGSDDPIIASRALKFRAGIAENEQFQRNVQRGIAWMNVTDAAFDNINSHLMFEMRRLVTQGATQTNSLANQMTTIQQLESLFDEISHAMNQRYAGSFLFSGFRQDEPPLFDRDQPERSFVITQHFTLNDIARERSFQRLPNADGLVAPVVHEVSVLKLAFDTIDFDGDVPRIHIPGFTVVPFSNTDVDAYLPPAPVDGDMPVIHFIRETGELVMHGETAAAFPREGVSVTFEKTGFRRGEPNPAVYFTSREITAATEGAAGRLPMPTDTIDRVYSITQYFSRAAGTSVGANYEFELALMPTFHNPTTTDCPSGFAHRLPAGATIMGTTVSIPASVFNLNTNVSVTYFVENPVGDAASGGPHIKQDLRVAGVELVRALDAGGMPVALDVAEPNRSFDMHNQDIYLEFSMQTNVAINSLAKNILTDSMFADFRRLFQFANSIVLSDRIVLEQHFAGPPHYYEGARLNHAVEEHRNWEYSMAQSALFDQFNNMLYLVPMHAEQTTREHTALGARMVRLDLIQDRLEADYVAYNRLKTQNEGTDMLLALTRRMSLMAAFEASLRANSGIVQMSLANFIR